MADDAVYTSRAVLDVQSCSITAIQWFWLFGHINATIPSCQKILHKAYSHTHTHTRARISHPTFSYRSVRFLAYVINYNSQQSTSAVLAKLLPTYFIEASWYTNKANFVRVKEREKMCALVCSPYRIAQGRCFGKLNKSVFGIIVIEISSQCFWCGKKTSGRTTNGKEIYEKLN